MDSLSLGLIGEGFVFERGLYATEMGIKEGVHAAIDFWVTETTVTTILNRNQGDRHPGFLQCITEAVSYTHLTLPTIYSV